MRTLSHAAVLTLSRGALLTSLLALTLASCDRAEVASDEPATNGAGAGGGTGLGVAAPGQGSVGLGTAGVESTSEQTDAFVMDNTAAATEVAFVPSGGGDVAATGAGGAASNVATPGGGATNTAAGGAVAAGGGATVTVADPNGGAGSTIDVPVASAGTGAGVTTGQAGATGEVQDDLAPPDMTLPVCSDTPPVFPFFNYEEAAFVSTVDAALTRLSGSGAALAAQMGGSKLCAGESSIYACTGRNEQFSTPDDAEAGVRGFKFRDGPRGLSEWEELSNANRKATAFPVSVARAATFDPLLEYQVGAAICREVLSAGWNNVLAPTVNITRHAGGGRAQESYGEDPFMGGLMGTAFVVGCQQYIQACPKHYAANNVEQGRQKSDAVMDEQTLRENYTRAFEMVVRDSDPACIMTAYNQVQGSYSSQNSHLLQELLRDTFGFRGFTVSDWEAAVTGAQSAEAGLDVEMPGRVKFGNIENEVDTATLQKSVRRILLQKFRFGWGDLGSGYQDTPQVTGTAAIFDNRSELEKPAHVELAREVARRSAVLLKNDGGALPLSTDITSMIVLAPTYNIVAPDPMSGMCVWNSGDESCHTDFEAEAGSNNYAQTARLGDKGSSAVWPNRASIISPYQGLEAAAQRYGISISYSSNAADAANADVAVIIGALTSFDEGEEWQNGADRETLDLDPTQDAFVAAAAAAANKAIVVLEGGAPITMENWKGAADAIVMAWYPGMQGGNAIADLLFAQDDAGTPVNFSGKLPQTWPVSHSDQPIFGAGQTSIDMGYYHGYRWFDNQGVEPLFHFGHGLNYGAVEYVVDSLDVGCSSVTSTGIVNAKVTVQNAGPYAVDETILVFIGYPNSTAPRRPTKEFKAAFHVRIEPMTAQQVTLALPVKDWAFFDDSAGVNDWVVEPVEHVIMVGPNAGNLLLQATVPVTP